MVLGFCPGEPGVLQRWGPEGTLSILLLQRWGPGGTGRIAGYLVVVLITSRLGGWLGWAKQIYGSPVGQVGILGVPAGMLGIWLYDANVSHWAGQYKYTVPLGRIAPFYPPFWGLQRWRPAGTLG